jgi:hypothetical protein
MDHRAIATTGPRRDVRLAKNGFDLVTGEMRNDSSVGSLDGDRQDAPAYIEGGGHPELHVMDERSNRGEPGISRRRGAATLLFQVHEKRQDELRIEIFEIESRRHALQARSHEVEKEFE